MLVQAPEREALTVWATSAMQTDRSSLAYGGQIAVDAGPWIQKVAAAPLPSETPALYCGAPGFHIERLPMKRALTPETLTKFMREAYPRRPFKVLVTDRCLHLSVEEDPIIPSTHSFGVTLERKHVDTFCSRIERARAVEESKHV